LSLSGQPVGITSNWLGARNSEASHLVRTRYPASLSARRYSGAGPSSSSSLCRAA
jgi:hypothetical protein